MLKSFKMAAHCVNRSFQLILILPPWAAILGLNPIYMKGYKMKVTSKNIDFEVERNYEKDIGVLNSPDFFEFDKPKSRKIVIFEHRPYFILHASRDIEKALVQGKKKEQFISPKYLLMDSGVLLDIPIIKLTNNFKCLHSMEEINSYYQCEIKKHEDEIKRLSSIHKRIVNDEKFKFPEKSSLEFSNKTDINIWESDKL